MSHRILVIEDDKDIAHLVTLHLRDMGCEVQAVSDGLSGLEKARTAVFHLIILDLMIPGLDGLEVCRRLRALPNQTRILMLTAKTSELDRVLGLEMGADDYMTKPFSILELLARVKALFRRMEVSSVAASAEAAPFVKAGDLVLDLEKHKVILKGKPVDLTAKEFDLLLQFARHPGRVYTRMQLLDLVWGYGHDGYEHTVNSHINRLRSKIEEDQAHPEYILTVWGVGYKFFEPDDGEES